MLQVTSFVLYKTWVYDTTAADGTAADGTSVHLNIWLGWTLQQESQRSILILYVIGIIVDAGAI